MEMQGRPRSPGATPHLNLLPQGEKEDEAQAIWEGPWSEAEAWVESFPLSLDGLCPTNAVCPNNRLLARKVMRSKSVYKALTRGIR